MSVTQGKAVTAKVRRKTFPSASLPAGAVSPPSPADCKWVGQAAFEVPPSPCHSPASLTLSSHKVSCFLSSAPRFGLTLLIPLPGPAPKPAEVSLQTSASSGSALVLLHNSFFCLGPCAPK